ncbi:MAG: NAD-dependent epimerase/dehydratase family protein [Solirubrobacteraceae bacterium]
MRVFLAGATGAIGRQLVPLLLQAGHHVTGTTRSHQRAQQLERAGASAVVLDAFDAPALRAAVLAASPQAVIHQLTSIPALIHPRKIARDFAANDRLRTEATRTLVDSARQAGAQRLIAQSIAFAYSPGPSGTVHVESDPLVSPQQSAPSFRRSAAAIAQLERTVVDADGVVLRYGYFYGPGTAIARDGALARELQRRRVPVIGGGTGAWSFIHIHDAASATLAALGCDRPGAINVVDDEPALVADWIPALARQVGAPRPLRVPASLARPFAGSYGIATMTRAQGASGELARRMLGNLGWSPRHPSWSEGFRTSIG